MMKLKTVPPIISMLRPIRPERSLYGKMMSNRPSGRQNAVPAARSKSTPAIIGFISPDISVFTAVHDDTMSAVRSTVCTSMNAARHAMYNVRRGYDCLSVRIFIFLPPDNQGKTRSPMMCIWAVRHDYTLFLLSFKGVIINLTYLYYISYAAF